MKPSPDHVPFGWLALLIVAGYFVVGFWPFQFQPHNQVLRLENRAGLHFEPYGIVYDPSKFAPPGAIRKSAANFTVELWLEAQHEPANDVFDILTIYNPRLPHDFTLCQWKQDFLLRATSQSPQVPGKTPEIGLDDALPQGKAVLIVIRGNETGTDFYLNGKREGHFPGFILNADALNGQLILGNGASGKHSWTGTILGLAVYDQAPDTTEIVRHLALWTEGRAKQLAGSAGLRALYLFNDSGGGEVKDSSGNHRDLIVPTDFQPVHRALLIPPWKDLAYHHPDYPDIVVNILGFMPFGFCFYLYRRSQKSISWITNLVWVIATGIAISLTIEIVQAWLPNRTSSLMDLLTNTVGTFLGVALAIVIRRKFQ